MSTFTPLPFAKPVRVVRLKRGEVRIEISLNSFQMGSEKDLIEVVTVSIIKPDSFPETHIPEILYPQLPSQVCEILVTRYTREGYEVLQDLSFSSAVP